MWIFCNIPFYKVIRTDMDLGHTWKGSDWRWWQRKGISLLWCSSLAIPDLVNVYIYFFFSICIYIFFFLTILLCICIKCLTSVYFLLLKKSWNLQLPCASKSARGAGLSKAIIVQATLVRNQFIPFLIIHFAVCC